MRPEFVIPRPTPAVVSWIKNNPAFSAHGGRVGTSLNQTLPAVRVTLLYYLASGGRWERHPVFQIEAWATNEAQADTLATDIANHWPDFRGNVGQAYISGAWLHSDGPIPMPDQSTNLFRYQFEAALSIHAGGM